MSSIYIDHGYESRSDYLRSLAEEYDIPLSTVHALASVLGPSEDFDALVVACQDVELLNEHED